MTWTEVLPSVAPGTGWHPGYAAWALSYVHIGFAESWASLSTGSGSSLPTAVTSQNYSVAGTLSTMANTTGIGGQVTGSWAPVGTDRILTGDAVAVVQPDFGITIGPGFSLTNPLGGIIVAHTPSGNVTLASLALGSPWVIRWRWITGPGLTTLSAGAGLYPYLPNLQTLPSMPAWTSANMTFQGTSGGATALTFPNSTITYKKYALYIASPVIRYDSPWPLSYSTRRWYDLTSSWQTGSSLPAAPVVVTYSSTGTVTAPTTSATGKVVGGTTTINQLGSALSGDWIITGVAGDFPTMTLTTGITLQQASTTSISVTVGGVTTTIATGLPTSGTWSARLMWTTTGGTTTYAAGASVLVVTPPALIAVASGTALTSIAPQLSGGVWGNSGPLSNSGTSTPVYPRVADFTVPFLPVGLSETGTGTEPTLPTRHVTTESAIGQDKTSIAAVLLRAENALGAETLAVLGRYLIRENGTGKDFLTAGQLVHLTESGVGSETLAILARIFANEQGTAIESIRDTITQTLKMSGLGVEKLYTTHKVTATGSGSETLKVTNNLTLRENGTGAETLQGAKILVTRDTATGTALITILGKIPLSDSGHGTELMALRWRFTDTAHGTEQISWVHYNGQAHGPVTPPTSLNEHLDNGGLAQSVNYPALTNGILQLGSFTPNLPESATAPLATGTQIPINAVFRFLFSADSELLGLDGQQVSVTCALADGRWITATMAVSAMAISGQSIITATTLAPISLAMPRYPAMFY